MTQSKKAINIIKFIGGTLLGILLVLIPFNFNGTVDTVLFYYLKQFIRANQSPLRFIIMILMCISAIVSLYDFIAKPDWIRNNKILKNIF
ncbi:MAG: arginine transporter, partial [Erysipelothrix sp.]|nr:arginine transporter [Erysipelothrix sp.]